MSTTTTNELNVETMTEIATLATEIVSKNGVPVEDMNKQVRRIAEHAGVVVGEIFELMYQHVQQRTQTGDQSRDMFAYRELVRIHIGARR